MVQYLLRGLSYHHQMIRRACSVTRPGRVMMTHTHVLTGGDHTLPCAVVSYAEPCAAYDVQEPLLSYPQAHGMEAHLMLRCCGWPSPW